MQASHQEIQTLSHTSLPLLKFGIVCNSMFVYLDRMTVGDDEHSAYLALFLGDLGFKVYMNTSDKSKAKVPYKQANSWLHLYFFS